LGAIAQDERTTARGEAPRTDTKDQRDERRGENKHKVKEQRERNGAAAEASRAARGRAFFSPLEKK
jgi:hypothetical protein